MNPYKEILRKFFSEYVSALRKRRGLTQEQMAEKLRITGRAYSDLERGIYCFSTVALVFLLLMLEEGGIKELLSCFVIAKLTACQRNTAAGML